MFIEFFLRCYRSFSRNAIVSLLPLAMPIVFLLLFLDATRNEASAPTFRVAVAAEQSANPLIDQLMKTGVVRTSPLPGDLSVEPIDARKHDAVLVSSGEGAELIVRDGFGPWAELLLAADGAVSGAQALPVPVRESALDRNNYLSFILPGLFVMVLIQLAMTSTANVVLGDRADGTFRMVASVKNALVPLVAAEVLFRLVFALLCYGFMMVVISQATDGWLEGRMLPFSLVFLLGAAMMIAFGYTLGGVLPGRRNWSAVVTLTGLAFWFFSDILFQASQHALARPLSLILPPTYMTDALRQIATGEPGTFPLAVDIGAMALVLVACSIVSVRCFRFDTNDDRH